MALVFAVSKWQHYLMGRKFLVLTNRYNLKYLVQRMTTITQLRWLSKFMGFDYEIA